MNELMLREKSYATARLPVVGSKTCCAIPRIGNRDYLAVASTDGYLFCYTIPPEAGECTLARQYRIGPLADEEAGEMSEVPRPPTTTKPIYPNVDAPAVDVAPVGSIGSYGTSPLNRSPPLIPSSA
uniref:Uncharacterized protein n=1 Tax=Panagrolaimus sp. JU765 TaxID=591449 RepID=A0AC34PZR8_9BILA